MGKKKRSRNDGEESPRAKKKPVEETIKVTSVHS